MTNANFKLIKFLAITSSPVLIILILERALHLVIPFYVVFGLMGLGVIYFWINLHRHIGKKK